jgi:hypothetical protein
MQTELVNHDKDAGSHLLPSDCIHSFNYYGYPIVVCPGYWRANHRQ